MNKISMIYEIQINNFFKSKSVENLKLTVTKLEAVKVDFTSM